MSLYVRTLGDGPDLLLIHGWGMHGEIWGDSTEALAQHYRVHVVDLPGMGWSPHSQPYDAASLANRLLALLPEPATVCGWSLGGLLAMHMAQQAPERVKRLILVGATPRFVKTPDWSCGMESSIFRQFAEQVATDYRGTMQRFLALQAFGNAAAKTVLKQLRERFIAGPMPAPQALQQALQLLLETDLRAQVPEFSQPTLVVHGERDTLAPVGAAYWMAEHLPQAQLEVIPGASHAPFLSHPERFMTAINRFMEP